MQRRILCCGFVFVDEIGWRSQYYEKTIKLRLLALVLFAGLREQMTLVKIPKGMQGTPIALITAGLLAMAFMGFSGVV